MSDLLERLDAAIGGPDRRTRDGRVRKLTPLKVETQLLLDAKAEIERLRTALEISCGARELANQEIERLREELDGTNYVAGGFAAENAGLRKLVQEALNGPGWMDEHWRDAAREALGDE